VVQSAVDDELGDGLLAVQHHRIHELRQNLIPELGIRQDDPLFGTTTTCHFKNLSNFSLLDEPLGRPTGLLRTLRAVLGAGLATVLDALRVEHAAQDVVAHAGKIAHTAAADEHHRVLLQVVAFARDVAK
jgi:hypothetical protein